MLPDGPGPAARRWDVAGRPASGPRARARRSPACARTRTDSPAGRRAATIALAARAARPLAGGGDRRRLPRRPRPVRRGRHAPGLPRAGRHPVHRRRACWRARWPWTRSSSRTSCAATACRWSTSRWFRRGAWDAGARRTSCATVAETLGARAVVKPARLGSSVGHVAGARARRAAGRPRRGVPLRQQGASWRRTSPMPASSSAACSATTTRSSSSPARSARSHEFYDYEAKYVEGLADVEPRAEVDPDLAARLKELSLAAYRAVDAAGLARVDFLVTPDDGVHQRDEHAPRLHRHEHVSRSRPSWPASASAS